MAKTVIALHPLARAADPRAARGAPAPGALADPRGRALRDLRISVTDRCNFRCTYCMPKEVFDAHYEFLPHAEILTFEEIVRMARIFRALGTEKIRLTGGEPLLRKDIERLVGMLREALPEVDLTLTTNGSALKAKARALKAAGLDRVTVSLDSLDDATFRAMNDADFPVAKVLEGIDAAAAAGLAPIKINMVVRRGVNDNQVVDMARHFAAPATSCATSSSWTWVPPTAGAWRRSCPRPKWSTTSPSASPSSPWSATTRARWRSAGATATARASSA